jgi:chemotaxis protein methyltransferase CheR
MGDDGAMGVASAIRSRDAELEAIELELLLEAVYRRYSFDFREYAISSLRRRLWKRVEEEGLQSISGLQERVLHDPTAMDRLLRDLSVNVTSMFRDPSFYRSFREHVVPQLRTYPFIRIWNAGCSTGEETWSVAIVLHEAGLLDRVRLYGTDVNASVLQRARSGSMSLERVKSYAVDYGQAGGTGDLLDYFDTDGDTCTLRQDLASSVVFAQHNLVSDRSFNEFHVIMCRNVMIYFGRTLQDRVHALLHESLAMFGFLALGRKESIRFTRHEASYQDLDAREKLYRKVA